MSRLEATDHTVYVRFLSQNAHKNQTYTVASAPAMTDSVHQKIKRNQRLVKVSKAFKQSVTRWLVPTILGSREKHLNLLSHGGVLYPKNPGTTIHYRTPPNPPTQPCWEDFYQGTATCNCWLWLTYGAPHLWKYSLNMQWPD